MSKPSHKLVVLVFYLNFLLWQFGSQLKFQVIADQLLPDDEVSTLTTIIDKLGLKSVPKIENTYCQGSGPSYGITISCGNCTEKDTHGNQTCHITEIIMMDASLTTVIPEELGDLPYLSIMDLSNNQLTGSIPETLGRLLNLQYLYLQYNLLDSYIPRILGSLSNLQSLYLYVNRLSGSIPDELGNLVNLTKLDLSENRLTGRLPDTFGNLSSLREFWAEANSLSGTVPESYGNLTNLTVFSIAGNYISGPLPVYIVKRWGYIETLSLLGNNFKGNLTKEVFSLPNLRHLLISDLENATFELPSKITNTEFVSLILRNCSINGPIPRYIGDQMPSLKYLDLSFNNLTGGLPGFMKSQDLLYMSFSTNMLNGTIPAWILEAVQTRIDISFNNFSALDVPEVPSNNNPDLNLFACCRNSTEPEVRDPLDMMNTYCQGKEQKYHSLFINCGGGETVINGIPYEQDNATSPFYTSPNKNWAYSTSGDFLVENANSSNYIQNMTCGISVAEAPLYDRARLSPVSLKYYAFCLREGKYNVSLKFAEIVYTEDTDYTSLRKREFDVYIQDDKVLHNFNIREQAGGPDVPTTKNFTAVVNKNNSLLMIHMYWDGKGSSEDSPTFNGPLISAISVTPDFKVHDEKLSPLRIALIAIASTIIAMLLLLAFAWSMGWLGSRNSYEIKVGEEKTDEGTQDIRVTLKELIDATGKFSKEKKIGDGSLGTVYKAQLQGQSKSTVAVEKLSSQLKEKEKEKLEQDIKFLYALNHTNIIKLFDCHIEKDLQLLVYEYMENKSLEEALSVDPDTRSVKFTWNTRLNICLGIARGLEYLHNHPRLNIAHLNIKADTILLDGNLEPKISDFRLAHLYAVVDHYKVIKREVSQGYMAPEYFHGILTSKADVYSFGVILLEIVSWKKNVIKSNDRTEVLVNTAHQKHERGNLEDMVDKTSGTYDTQQALTILKLAVKCTSIAPSVRPTMSDVVSVLLGEKKIEDLFKSSPNDGEDQGQWGT